MVSYNVTLPCSGWRIHTSQIQQLLLCQSLCSVLNRGIRLGLQPASHGLRKNNAKRVDGRAASIQVISMKLNAIAHYSILQQYGVSQPHSVIYKVYALPLFCLCSGSGVIPVACMSTIARGVMSEVALCLHCTYAYNISFLRTTAQYCMAQASLKHTQPTFRANCHHVHKNGSSEEQSSQYICPSHHTGHLCTSQEWHTCSKYNVKQYRNILLAHTGGR